MAWLDETDANSIQLVQAGISTKTSLQRWSVRNWPEKVCSQEAFERWSRFVIMFPMPSSIENHGRRNYENDRLWTGNELLSVELMAFVSLIGIVVRADVYYDEVPAFDSPMSQSLHALYPSTQQVASTWPIARGEVQCRRKESVTLPHNFLAQSDSSQAPSLNILDE